MQDHNDAEQRTVLGGSNVNEKKFEELMLDDAVDIFRNDIDAILLADAKANTIRPLVKRGIFSDFIEDSWKYTDLIEKLWYQGLPRFSSDLGQICRQIQQTHKHHGK